MWKPEIGDRLESEVDELNQHDRYAVGIIGNRSTVRRIPYEMVKTCFLLTKTKYNQRSVNW